jgi:hypothetical protein
VNNIIIGEGNDHADPSKPSTSKRFWSFIKSLRKDSPLKSNGVLIADAKGKANILNKQYESVFTREDLENIPDKGPSPHVDMDTIQVGEQGVLKLLQGLNPHKASGPDAMPTRVLRNAPFKLL